MKICILCMSCNKDIFKYQEIVARNTWISHLKEEGIDVYIFTGSNRNEIIDDKIYCNIPDDVNHTYEKTICALSQISIDNYDFIIRTNLTTYINGKLLIKYCEFLKDNNYDISNGLLCIKDNIIHYRGNSLIMSKKTTKYLLDNIYDNNEHIHDDAIFQNIFKNIPYLKIHSVPYRNYCLEGIFINHPQTIKEINKDTCEGIVFISYRIIGRTIGLDDNKLYYRCIELGRCYEIDMIYNQLDNNYLKDNFNLLFSDNKFITYKDIIQENNKLNIIQEQENIEDLLNIYICAHKEFDKNIIPYNNYKIIYNKDCDNDLNNIEQLYSEGYQIYDIYKNQKLSEYIGICHYRRYFDCSYDDILNNLRKDNIILPNPITFGNQTIYQQYNGSCNEEDLRICGAIIKKYYPDYLEDYFKVTNGYKLYPCNMMICSKEIFIEYCKWVFDILDRYKKHRKFNNIDDVKKFIENNKEKYTNFNNSSIDNYFKTIEYNIRICGHLMERLLNIFVSHNFKKEKIKTYPIKIIE